MKGKRKFAVLNLSITFVFLMALPGYGQTTRRPVTGTTKAVGTMQRAPAPIVRRPITTKGVWTLPKRLQPTVKIDPSSKDTNVVQCRTSNVPMTGTNLNAINRAVVYDMNGNIAQGVTGRLDWNSYMDGNIQRRNIGVEAQCSTAPGNYTLILFQGDLVLPNGSAFVTVYPKPAAIPPTAPAQQPPNETLLTTEQFADASLGIVRPSMLLANSCGPTNAGRLVNVDMAATGYHSSTPLSRYERDLTVQERVEIIPMRFGLAEVCAVRSCVSFWYGAGWRGFIGQGNFVIRIPFGDEVRFKIRGMPGAPVCVDDIMVFKWGNSTTDWYMPDTYYSDPVFYVTLVPIIDAQGRLSYGQIRVALSPAGKWELSPFSGMPGSLKDDLETYMQNRIADISNEIGKAFDTAATRDKFATAIMGKLSGVGSVKGISSSYDGKSLKITY